MSDFLNFIRDPQEMAQMRQNLLAVLNRGLVAQTLGAPVDLANLGLNAAKAGVGYVGHKAGLLSADQMPQLDEKPVGGSEWIGNKMQRMGLLGEYRNPMAEAIAGGLLAPLGGAAVAQRAPQIARGLLQIQENAAKPSTMANQGQRGMALFAPGTPGETIKSETERLAALMRERGWTPEVTHSGSAAGPSSYINAFDESTGRTLRDLRLSDHSKGAYNSQFVANINTGDFPSVLAKLDELRAMGPSDGMKAIQAREAEQAAKIAARAQERLMRAIEKQKAGEALSKAEASALKLYENQP